MRRGKAVGTDSDNIQGADSGAGRRCRGGIEEREERGREERGAVEEGDSKVVKLFLRGVDVRLSFRSFSFPHRYLIVLFSFSRY